MRVHPAGLAAADGAVAHHFHDTAANTPPMNTSKLFLATGPLAVSLAQTQTPPMTAALRSATTAAQATRRATPR
jgi:LDH2 family malate/lactate/ureidoglycolate dehydrogenase